MRAFLSDIVEKVYNPIYVDITIITHDLGDGPLTGNREELLDGIDDLNCGQFPNDDMTDYDSALKEAYDILDGLTADEQKIVVISFCVSEDDDDDTCNVPSTSDPTGTIEITVVNAGEDVFNNDQFACLVPDGTDSENYFEFPTINEETLLPETDYSREVCEQLTPAPTPTPNLTPNVTAKPTNNPTPRPTWV